MKRRVFDNRHDAGQVLVTYEPTTDSFGVATRPAPEATWGPPLALSRTDDDAGHETPAMTLVAELFAMFDEGTTHDDVYYAVELAYRSRRDRP